MTLLLLWMCLLGAPDTPIERRDTVVVTGAYDPVAIEETDRSVNVIDVPRQAPGSTTLVDLLRLDSSVDVRQRAAGGNQTDLSIRGGTFGQALILVDGLRLNDPQTGHHNLDLPMPLESVSGVEVLKGSGSTLYGSDAVGGVVNFITRPAEASQLKMRGAAGNFGVNQQAVTLDEVKGRWAQRLSATRDFSSGFIPNRDYRSLSLASVTYLSTVLGSSRMTLGHSDRPFGADMFYGNYNSWERTKTWFASLSQELGENTQAAFSFRRHTDLFVLRRYQPEFFTNRHAVESYQGVLRRHRQLATNTRLHYGAEVAGDSIESSNLGAHSRTTGAAYMALDFRALGRFSFSAGLREQLYGSKNLQLSPSLAGGVWLTPRVKLRTSASHAFRLPTYTDLYYRDPATIGSPLLRPERAWSYDAGVDWNSCDRWRGDLTVFHRRETDGIDYVRLSPNDVWRAENIQKLRFTGIEASVFAQISTSQRVDLRYTALQGSRDALAGMMSRYVFNYPTNSAVLSWQSVLAAGFTARARIGLTQRLNRDPYAVVDLYVAHAGRRLRPFLQLTNLSGVSYQEVVGVPMPGRAVVGGIEWAVFGTRD